MKKNGMTRRKFVGGMATSALGATIVPRHVLGGKGFQAPSDTVNVAAVGAGGMGSSNMSRLTSQNIVAICDVDWPRVEGSMRDREGNVNPNRVDLKAAYDKAKRYEDFRLMLDEQPDIEAVVIATPDHVHAAVASMAMQMGKHVYVQKPLTWSVKESRELARLAKETGVVTQMGNQGHSNDDARRINEIVQAGVIGTVRHVDVWTNRPIWPQGMSSPPPAPVREGLNWDLWLGPAKYTEYGEGYCPFVWRGWLDYGVGALGDMGAHLIDHPYWALGLSYPSTIEATSSPWGEDVENLGPGPNGRPQFERTRVSHPLACKVHYTFPGRGMLPPVTMTWTDGGLMPRRPEQLPDDVPLDRGGGVFLHGEKGILMHETYGNNPQLFPRELEQDAARVPQSFKRIPEGSGGHEMNWIETIKGNSEASSPLEYAGPLNETMLLGLVALQTGQGVKIEWDGEKGEVTNNPEANQYLHRDYREGYTL